MLRLIVQSKRIHKKEIRNNQRLRRGIIKKKKIIMRTPKMIPMKEAASTQIATKTATFSLARGTDEEIDTPEIELEDWIERMKKEQTAGEENGITTKRKMGKASSRMESRSQQQHQDTQSKRKTNTDGKTKSTNSSSEETEATKGSDTNNDTWIRVAKQKDKWKEKRNLKTVLEQYKTAAALQ